MLALQSTIRSITHRLDEYCGVARDELSWRSVSVREPSLIIGHASPNWSPGSRSMSIQPSSWSSLPGFVSRTRRTGMEVQARTYSIAYISLRSRNVWPCLRMVSGVACLIRTNVLLDDVAVGYVVSILPTVGD